MSKTDIVLEVDGEEIPMNEFVKKIMCGMITGSIETLRGVEDNWKTVTIYLKK